MVDYEDDGEEEVVIEDLNDSNFAEEQEDFVACVVQKLLCNQKAPDTTQQHQIFYSRCSVKNKVCNIIIDNKNCENIVSRALIIHMKLEKEPHPHPYTICWIKKDFSIKVTDLYHVPISVSKYYQEMLPVMWWT